MSLDRCTWHRAAGRPVPRHFRVVIFAVIAAGVAAGLAPGLAWGSCEARYPHTPESPGWCVGFAGFVDADFSLAGETNELVMVERAFSGAFVERRQRNRRFALGLDYAYRNYDADEPIGGNLDLYTLTLSPMWVIRQTDREWLMRLAVSRATSSNRNLRLDVRAEEVLFAGSVVARQVLDNDRVVVYGLARDYLFGSAHTYPVVGLEWPLNRSWQFGLILPAPYLRWQRDVWSAEFQLRPAGSRWHVLNDNNGLDFDTTVRAMRLSAAAGWRFRGAWRLVATFGVGFNRSLSSVASDGQPLTVGLDESLYGAIALYHGSAPGET